LEKSINKAEEEEEDAVEEEEVEEAAAEDVTNNRLSDLFDGTRRCCVRRWAVGEIHAMERRGLLQPTAARTSKDDTMMIKDERR
jgi:hypothetical protein